MTPSLPSAASLTQLKHQAKDLLKAHKAGGASCCEVLCKLNRFSEVPDANILSADIALKEVQFALAMHYGFRSWSEMKDHVAGVEDSSKSTSAAAGSLAGTATLGAQEYRFEWLPPRRLFDAEPVVDGVEHYPEACRSLWGRTRHWSDESDPYCTGHVRPLYNLQEDIGPVPPPETEMYGAFWFERGRSLIDKVERFALLAFADGGLAGTIRFFPKTLTVPHWGGWGRREHRREWTDDILWIGCAYVDMEGMDDGLDLELTRRVVAMAQSAGFAKVQATGWGELPVYAMWGQAFRASVFRAAGFTPIAVTEGCPDALNHMLDGRHGERCREVARSTIETGISLNTAHQCSVLELPVPADASEVRADGPPAPPELHSGGIVGETVLHWAARYGQADTTEWLLVNGASVNVRNREGLTPLQLAESAEVREIFRRHGAVG